MPHVLAKLRGVGIEEIGTILRTDAPYHAQQGLFLDHLWQNTDDANEVMFLFRTDDLHRARQFIELVHAQARKEDPDVNLPAMTFLQEH
jgi:hypothetical protein